MEQPRIIVIEDQEDLAALYRATLEQAGYRVTNAYTGEEGVAEFEADGADAILLDITLPEMRGVQVLREIRATSPSVPIIIATGETNDETRKECENLGVQDYLAKPVAHKQLLASLKRALDTTPDGEEYEVITLRLPARVVAALTRVDSNLERAVTQLIDARVQRSGVVA